MNLLPRPGVESTEIRPPKTFATMSRAIDKPSPVPYQETGCDFRQDFGLGNLSDLDFKAEFADSARQALGSPIAVEAGEVQVAEVPIGHPVAQQVISCGQGRVISSARGRVAWTQSKPASSSTVRFGSPCLTLSSGRGNLHRADLPRQSDRHHAKHRAHPARPRSCRRERTTASSKAQKTLTFYHA